MRIASVSDTLIEILADSAIPHRASWTSGTHGHLAGRWQVDTQHLWIALVSGTSVEVLTTGGSRVTYEV